MHNTTTVTSLDGIEYKKNYDFVDKQTFRFDIQTNTVKIYSTALLSVYLKKHVFRTGIEILFIFFACENTCKKYSMERSNH